MCDIFPFTCRLFQMKASVLAGLDCLNFDTTSLSAVIYNPDKEMWCPLLALGEFLQSVCNTLRANKFIPSSCEHLSLAKMFDGRSSLSNLVSLVDAPASKSIRTPTILSMRSTLFRSLAVSGSLCFSRQLVSLICDWGYTPWRGWQSCSAINLVTVEREFPCCVSHLKLVFMSCEQGLFS